MGIAKTCSQMDLELKKLPAWLTYLDAKLPELQKGRNPAAEILKALEIYKTTGHKAVMRCLRDIEEQFKIGGRITQDVNVLANMIQEFRESSNAVFLEYARLGGVQDDLSKSLDGVVRLREALKSLQASYGRLKLVRKVLEV